MKNENSEDEVRNQIKSILNNTENIEKADDKCSGIEFGVDLTFQKKDVFGIVRHYGIQIKTKNITSSKNKKTENVKEIIAQLAIAFGHPFPPADKNLDAVYVVTTGNINSYAQEHIKSSRVGFREIYFVDGSQLEKWIKTNEANTKIFEEV